MKIDSIKNFLKTLLIVLALFLLPIITTISFLINYNYENEMKRKARLPKVVSYKKGQIVNKYDSTFVDTSIYDLMKLNTVGNISGNLKGSHSYSEEYFLGIGSGKGSGGVSGSIKTTDYYVFYTKQSIDDETRIIRNKIPCKKVILVSKKNTAKFYIITTTHNNSIEATTLKYPGKKWTHRVPLVTVKNGDTLQLYRNKREVEKTYKLLIDDSYITHL